MFCHGGRHRLWEDSGGTAFRGVGGCHSSSSHTVHGGRKLTKPDMGERDRNCWHTLAPNSPAPCGCGLQRGNTPYPATGPTLNSSGITRQFRSHSASRLLSGPFSKGLGRALRPRTHTTCMHTPHAQTRSTCCTHCPCTSHSTGWPSVRAHTSSKSRASSMRLSGKTQLR